MITKEKLILFLLIALFALSIFVGLDTRSGQTTRGSSASLSSRTPVVAVIPLYGVIESSDSDFFVSNGIDSVMEMLEAVEEENSVKAIVLRVNSPGGNVGSSQELYQAVKRFRSRTHKPVVVSIVDYGASGAYWVSLAGDYIMANQGSMVGSMGVIAQTLDLSQIKQKYGVGVRTYKAGEMKDMLNPWRPDTEQERQLMQQMLENVHAQFVNVLMENRKLPRALAEKLADGRIYTGEQALSLGLIDQVGSLEDAVTKAAQLAHIKGTPRVIQKSRLGVRQFVKLLKSQFYGATARSVMEMTAAPQPFMR